MGTTLDDAPILSAHEIDVMRHALGINQPGRCLRESVRNYFAADPGGDDFHAFGRLESLGLAVRSRSITPSTLCYFRVTQAGCDALRAYGHS